MESNHAPDPMTDDPTTRAERLVAEALHGDASRCYGDEHKYGVPICVGMAQTALLYQPLREALAPADLMRLFIPDPDAPGVYHHELTLAGPVDGAVSALLAEAMHKECEDEWDRALDRDPGWQGTMHGPDAHHAGAVVLIADLPAGWTLSPAPPPPADTHEPGIRSVLGNLLSHIRDHDIPASDTTEYAAFIDQWADRLLKTTGYYREQEKAKNAALRDALAGGA